MLETRKALLKLYEERNNKTRRPHLGASEIGHPCERASWYKFHWCLKEIFDGRMQRLFETGEREEQRVKQNLREIGCIVFDENEETALQFGFVDGHFAGSIDGVVTGLPDDHSPHLLEIKTANDRSFKEIQTRGVMMAKPQHYTQMQAYMGKMQLGRALYWCTNKNTDEIYLECVGFDPFAFDSIMAKKDRILRSTEPLPKLSDDPKSFDCKFCNFADICHGDRIPEANCRTCAHSTPIKNGEWTCAQKRAEILSQTGCGQHLYIPPLMPAVVVDSSDDWVMYETKRGTRFVNLSETGFPAERLGEKDTRLYDSAELQNMTIAVIDDDTVEATRQILGGRIERTGDNDGQANRHQGDSP